MSDTRHQIDLLTRRWPDIEWRAEGQWVIVGRRRQGSTSVIVTSSRCGGDEFAAEGFDWFRVGPTRVAAIEAWMMTHPLTTDFLGVLSDAARVTQLEAEVKRLRAELAGGAA